VQKLAKIQVYPGANAEFSVYEDDGKTYAYEQGKSTVTSLHWDEAAGKLTGADVGLVEVVGR
jgi:alpha-D-xyloside xylohydrolase